MKHQTLKVSHYRLTCCAILREETGQLLSIPRVIMSANFKLLYWIVQNLHSLNHSLLNALL